jgi:PhnB protein
MKLDIYLNYRGNCEQAFRFYEQHLGGTRDLATMTNPLRALLTQE